MITCQEKQWKIPGLSRYPPPPSLACFPILCTAFSAPALSLEEC